LDHVGMNYGKKRGRKEGPQPLLSHRRKKGKREGTKHCNNNHTSATAKEKGEINKNNLLLVKYHILTGKKRRGGGNVVSNCGGL